MIGRLRGTFAEQMPSGVLIIDCGGVGYEVIPTRRLREQLELERPCTIVIYTDVKEDSIKLFGFADHAEREVFNLLLRVSGIGTKTAREIISGIEIQTLLRAIGQADVSRLQAIKGIGKKTAERIVLELRDLVAQFRATDLASGEIKLDAKGFIGIPEQQHVIDAIEALVALGFARSDAERAVSQADRTAATGIFDSGKLVAEALRFV